MVGFVGMPQEFRTVFTGRKPDTEQTLPVIRGRVGMPKRIVTLSTNVINAVRRTQMDAASVLLMTVLPVTPPPSLSEKLQPLQSRKQLSRQRFARYAARKPEVVTTD